MSEELAAAGRNGNQDSRAHLKQSLATRLRDEILQGRIAPGQKIIEVRWARHFGVAQLSIREALNILAAEGFVTKRHGRSARVLSLTESDIIHIYQVPEVSNHQRILDALRMGDPHLAEQTVVHITGLFLRAALAVWTH